MTLKLEIENRFKKALKDKDKLQTSALRMIKSAVQTQEIDKKGELDDSEIIKVLATLKKQRQESITSFAQGGRQDLVDKEERELAIIESLLPQKLSPEEIKAEIAKAIEETGAASVKDLGKVMKALMPSLTGRADGKEVNAIVRQMLENK